MISQYILAGLNHDKWHSVSVTVSGIDSRLSVQVDSRPTKTVSVKAFEDGTATKAIGDGNKQALVYVGGRCTFCTLTKFWVLCACCTFHPGHLKQMDG